LRKWTPGTLLGLAAVELQSGPIHNNLRMTRGKSGLWVAMPSVKRLGREGNPARDLNGNETVDPIVEYRDRAIGDRFSRLVVELIQAAHPEALDQS
jgi:DNA-binding cell septation regulator SpoVG